MFFWNSHFRSYCTLYAFSPFNILSKQSAALKLGNILLQLTGVYSDFTSYIYQLSFVCVCVCVCVHAHTHAHSYAFLLQGWLHVSNPTITIFICTIATNLPRLYLHSHIQPFLVSLNSGNHQSGLFFSEFVCLVLKYN